MADWQVLASPTKPYSVAGPSCRGHRLLARRNIVILGVSLAFAGTLLVSSMLVGLGPCSLALSVTVAAGASVAIAAALGPKQPSLGRLGRWPHHQDQPPEGQAMRICPICGHQEPFFRPLQIW